MSNVSAVPTFGPAAGVVTDPVVTAKAASIMVLAITTLLALTAYFFIGMDEGAFSVFGDTVVVHEFFHDGRHFLGFPCH